MTAGKTELVVIPVWVPRLSVRFSAVYIALLLTEFIEGAGKFPLDLQHASHLTKPLFIVCRNRTR